MKAMKAMNIQQGFQKEKIGCPIPFKIGYHIEKDDLLRSAKELLGLGGGAIQLYLSNKISFNPGSPLSQWEVTEIKKLRKEQQLYVVVHGKLILNLCQDDMRNIPALTCDIMEAARIDADVIIHQGKNVKKLSREEALIRYVINIQEAIDQTAGLKTKIILENSCQQGTELGYHLDDLVTIWNLLGAAEVNKIHMDEVSEVSELSEADKDDKDDKADKADKADKLEVEEGDWKLTNYQQRIGFCLDLCHAHVGGMINMRDPNHVVEVMEEFNKKIGLKNLTVIHFNDSEIPFNGHNDSHCDILMGQIGNPDEPIGGNSLGFRKIVEYCSKYSIPIIFETPKKIPIELQIALVQSWALQLDYSRTFAKDTKNYPFDRYADQNLDFSRTFAKDIKNYPFDRYADQNLDFENVYLEKTQEIRDLFSNDPRSRKGRKKVVADPKPKPKPSLSLNETTKTQVIAHPKRVEIIKRPVLKIIPIKRNKSSSSTAMTSSTTMSSSTSFTDTASSADMISCTKAKSKAESIAELIAGSKAEPISEPIDELLAEPIDEPIDELLAESEDHVNCEICSN
jgi:deoxyribonuclease-4